MVELSFFFYAEVCVDRRSDKFRVAELREIFEYVRVI